MLSAPHKGRSRVLTFIHEVLLAVQPSAGSVSFVAAPNLNSHNL
jgi:hypothetical protein